MRALVRLKSYAELRRRVEEAFQRGRERAGRAVEQERVRTYWEVGQLIRKHVLLHGDRAEYGERVIQRLSGHLEVGPTLLYDCLRLARAYPILRARVKLEWKHYVKLLSVEDPAKRKALTQQAEKENWTTRKLAAEIAESEGRAREISKERRKKAPRNRLIPKRGKLHTYRVVRSKTLDGRDTLFIDFGFRYFEELPSRFQKRFREGDIFEVRSKNRFVKLPKATKHDLFTYEAAVEKVIDGDTQWLWIDLGLGNWTRRKLRLRGIDCPELGTRLGKKAKEFVERELGEAVSIVVTTTKPDKFDRYLTDLYYRKKDGPEIFLNQLLLDRGLARLSDE